MRKHTSLPNGKERGFVLLLTVLTMLATLPIIGMAIDIGMIYLIQTRLSAAIDAGALAGARSFNRGLDLASQTTAAEQTALKYFRANFPDGYMGTALGSNPTITVAVDGAKRTVTINANVTAPMYFLRYLTINSAPVAVTGQATRGDVNLIMVLDRSGSLANSGYCDDMIAAAVGFVGKFSEGRDNLGLVTFARSSTKNYPADLNFKTSSPNITSLIGAINCAGWTFGSGGISMGWEELQRLNQPGALNVIVYFTDGMPNVMAADYPIKRAITAYSNVPNSVSTCAVALTNLTGALSRNGDGTEGIWSIIGTINPPQDSGMIPSAERTSCKISSTGANSVEGDIAYIPDTDIWGTSADGHFGSALRYSSGTYSGKIKTYNGSNLENVIGMNLVDNKALSIRNDATLKPIIFTIGLGNVGATQDDLLRRVANDELATNHDPSKQIGKYIFVADGTGLDNAFQQIASEILRLSM